MKRKAAHRQLMLCMQITVGGRIGKKRYCAPCWVNCVACVFVASCFSFEKTAGAAVIFAV